MTTRGARTRAYNKSFDARPFLHAVGAAPMDASMGRLPSGRMVSCNPGRVGRVALMLLEHEGEPLRLRNFGSGQLEEMREWVASGGTLSAEERRKALHAAAEDMFAALEAVLPYAESRAEDVSESPGAGALASKAWAAVEKARAAIAKAKGEEP